MNSAEDCCMQRYISVYIYIIHVILFKLKNYHGTISATVFNVYKLIWKQNIQNTSILKTHKMLLWECNNITLIIKVKKKIGITVIRLWG